MNPSGDRAGHDAGLPKLLTKQEEMAVNVGRMTTDCEAVEMREESQDRRQQGARSGAQDLDPLAPLESLRDVMQAILTNLQHNTRAIKAVGSAVGDLGILLFGRMAEDRTILHARFPYHGGKFKLRWRKLAPESQPPAGRSLASTFRQGKGPWSRHVPACCRYGLQRAVETRHCIQDLR